jgi:hypothetical protein
MLWSSVVQSVRAKLTGKAAENNVIMDMYVLYVQYTKMHVTNMYGTGPLLIIKIIQRRIQ